MANRSKGITAAQKSILSIKYFDTQEVVLSHRHHIHLIILNVIVSEYARLARSSADMLRIVNDLQENGICRIGRAGA